MPFLVLSFASIRRATLKISDLIIHEPNRQLCLVDVKGCISGGRGWGAGQYSLLCSFQGA